MITYFKKITAGVLITILVVGVSGIPQKAEAQLATAEVTGFARLIQNIQQAASSLSTQFSTYSLQWKAFVLDTLATTLAKQVIRTLTADIVNWINSGFEGSPAFMTNPGGALIDIADQITGEFLHRAGGPLTDLCSPFSIDIRLALAFKYHPNVRKKYECTLGKIISNTRNAVAGASINGFTAGDFRQGGWPAFVSLTTEPQNNIYGAYLQADSELSIRVANAQLIQRDEVSNGRGFLSWRNPKCAKEVKTHNATVQKMYEERTSDYNTTVQTYSSGISINQPSLTAGTGDYNSTVQTTIAGGDASALTLRSKKDCPIETPGSFIAGGLEASGNGPLRELELVDSINEIVNALAAQLMTTALRGGLKALSGSGPSDKGSYLNEIKEEANTNPEQVDRVRNEFISNVEKYITDTLLYKTTRNQTLNLILEAKNKYESVKACYVNRVATAQPPFTPAQVSAAQAKITATDQYINTTIAPVASTSLAASREADDRYTTLTTMRDEAIAAKTIKDLDAPTARFTQLLQAQRLTTPKDLTDSKQALDEVTTLVSPMGQDVNRKLQECAAFPNIISQ